MHRQLKAGDKEHLKLERVSAKKKKRKGIPLQARCGPEGG